MILKTILTCSVLLTSLASSTIVSAQTRRADLCGKWEQRCLVSGKWMRLGTFEVTLERGKKLEMKLSEKTQFAEKLGSNGISNVDLTANVWTFDSDWGAAGTANFSLAQDELGRFVGYPYVNGNRRSLNLWVKLDSNPVLKPVSYTHLTLPTKA